MDQESQRLADYARVSFERIALRRLMFAGGFIVAFFYFDPVLASAWFAGGVILDIVDLRVCAAILKARDQLPGDAKLRKTMRHRLFITGVALTLGTCAVTLSLVIISDQARYSPPLMFLFAAALYWSIFQPQFPDVAQTRIAILAVTAAICTTWRLVTDMPPAHSPQWIQAIAEAFVITFIVGCSQVAQKQYNHSLSQTLAIQRAMEQAKAAAEGKGDLLRVLSHELRTPLNGVLGMAELMRLGPLTPAQAQQVEAIRDAGQRLTELVTDVLDSERLERGGLKVIKTPTDVTGLLHRVHDRFHQAADAKQISLTCEHDQMPLGDLVVDPVRL